MSHRALPLAFVVGFGAVSASVMAQQPQQPPQLTVTQLKPTVHEVEGGGGNSTVIVGYPSRCRDRLLRQSIDR